MLDWLKNITKEYPDYWKDYIAKMDKKNTNRYVAFSIEKTGLNLRKDVILSIGAIAIIKDQIIVGDTFEIAIPQYKHLHENGFQHEFNTGRLQTKLAEPAAIENFIKYIDNSILVGHRAYFDVEMLNTALEKLGCGRLRNEALDVEIMYKKLHAITDKNYSLDEIAQQYKLPTTETASSADDAYTTALLFLKLKAKLGFK